MLRRHFLLLIATPAAASGRRDEHAPDPPETALPRQAREGQVVSEPRTIRVDANLVLVPVSVSDEEGRMVPDLAATDFRIEEDGRSVTVVKLGDPGEVPLDLALLLDVSGSLNPRFQFQLQAAIRFLQKVVRSEDTVTLLTVESQPRILVERTPSLEEAIGQLNSLQPTFEATAFYDAVVRACRTFGSRPPAGSRRVLVALSDGEDNRSETGKLQESVEAIQEADCIFYAINPAGASIRLNKISAAGHAAMEDLAAQTGGAAFLADNLSGLDTVFDRVSQEIKSQYLLGYYSGAGRRDGSLHRIRVYVPSRPGARIRARKSFNRGSASADRRGAHD